ncbi:MAG: nicotinamide mononucleotide transporter [Flavobacteriales bacterium]
MESIAQPWRRILEANAVLANLAFTWLYLNDSNWAYVFGLLGPILLLILCIRERLYAEPVLQLVYLILTGYGWFHSMGEPWILDVVWHAVAIPICFMVAYLAAKLLRQTEARYPFQDSMITAFGIFATWLMMNQDPKWSWYFLFINALSAWIYFRRSLYFGVAMYAIYFLMALDVAADLSIFSP